MASSPRCAFFTWASNALCSDFWYSSRFGRWLMGLTLNRTPAQAAHSASTGISPIHLETRKEGFFISQLAIVDRPKKCPKQYTEYSTLPQCLPVDAVPQQPVNRGSCVPKPAVVSAGTARADSQANAAFPRLKLESCRVLNLEGQLVDQLHLLRNHGLVCWNRGKSAAAS
jgi:hypothetical protein